ncbi:MAG: GAF domain-containing protein [Elainella sp. Prado103]|jgi:PAS domain S-box-containing protein|nr:GAF domain-containing protein [Elainella sp. Prado103]
MHQVPVKESILIIDDRPANLRLLSHLLSQQGYHVRLAPKLDAALAAITIQTPDLILLDICMPGHDGFEVCQMLKADPKTQHIPVIFLSALENTWDKVRAFKVGGVDYILKPFHAEEVLVRIESQLNIQRLQKQLIEHNERLQEAIHQREQVEQKLAQQLEQSLVLQKITGAIRTETESQTIFDTTVQLIGQIFRVTRCSIHIYVPPPIPEIPLLAEHVSPGWISLRQMDFAFEDNVFIPEVLSQDRALAADAVPQDPRFNTIRSFCQLAEIRSLLAVRTSYRHRPNGLITLQQCDRFRSWTTEEISLLEAIAIQIGFALAQAKSVDQEQKQLEALEYQNRLLRQEVHERRQIESALQSSEAELRGLFAAMADVILVLDREGRYLKIAPTNQENLYRPAELLLGKTLHQVFPTYQAERFLTAIHTSLDQQRPLELEYDLLIQNRTVWFSTRISPIGTDTVIWVARDITARKQTEAELLQKSVALSEYSQSLKHLHRLSLTDFETIEELCADYLKTGCEILGFSSGIAGAVTDQTYRVIAAYSEIECLQPGLEINLEDTYCNVVVKSRQTICCQNIQDWQFCIPLPKTPLPVQSYIGSPLWVNGELYGTLCFFADQTRPQGYQKHEQEVIELMAQSIAKFISAHQANAQRQQAEEELQLLLNITQAITAAPDFDQALYAALQALCEVTGWTYGEVWLPSADGSVLECSPVWYSNQAEPSVVQSIHNLRQSYANVTFHPNEGIAGRVWNQQQPEWSLNSESEVEPALEFESGQSRYRFQLVNHYGIKARLGVPIMVTRDQSSTATTALPPSHPALANSPLAASSTASTASTQTPTVLAVLVFFTIEARPIDQRLIQVVSAVAAQLGTVLAQKQAEADLQALFAAMSDVVLVRDRTGRCLRVASANPALDRPTASILGKTLHETLPAPIADRVLQSIQASLTHRITVNLEYSLSLAEREVCLSSSISPLSKDAVLIVSRDISDRKQVEQALARRERYLAVLVEVQRELLTFRESPIKYQEILRLLGQVAGASRVYLCEITAEGGRFQPIQRAGWQANWQKNPLRQPLPQRLPHSLWLQWMHHLARSEVISDAVTSCETERSVLVAEGILSILILPLIVNGKLWGLVGFEDNLRAHHWDGLDISLLGTAVSAIALHYERKLAEDALRRSAAREQATLRVIEQMRQTLEIKQIFQTTTTELRQLLQCDRVLIYRFNPDWSGSCVAESVSAGWRSVLQAEPGSPDHLAEATQTDRCIIQTWTEQGWVQDTYLQETEGGAYRQGAPYLCVRDIYQPGFSACYLKLLEQLQAKAYLTVPILQGNHLWGLLAAYQNRSSRNWQTAEIHLATHISTQLGVAIQQADLLAQTQQQSEDLKKARDAAEAASRAKTQFLAHMSHELRTPLNSILGFTQLISQEASLTPDHQDYLHIINRSGQHLLNLINDVLEGARLEANQGSLQESSFDLYGLLRNITEMLQLAATQKQLQFMVQVQSTVPNHIAADQGKLRQVLLNLLDNAIKFTDQGQVCLRVSGRLGNSDEQTHWLHFAVEDTGYGIASEEMDSLFQAFVQTESGRQSNRGTGLGLAISDRFVQLMGGQLTVHSLPGEGSIFEFEIPVREGVFTQSAEHQRVNCIYEEGEVMTTPSSKLATADLLVMPAEWIADLHQAASGCSDRQVLKLLEQIPSTHAELAQGLRELAYDFRFEEIIELTKLHI